MNVVGIETSCDETGVALVRDGSLACEELATQVDAHAVFGGVVPEIASREHLRVLPVLFERLLDGAGLAPADIDAVAVARGPGLLGALLMGVSFAKGVCVSTGAKLIGVNHLHAHLLAPGLERDISFPALGLLVSGGHTHIYFMRSATEFELLGRTLDDAAGEAFDKIAKRLNFPYPGGRFIDELGVGVEPEPKLFPRAYIDNDNLDFSFSGLKTAVVQYVDKHPELILPSMADPRELDADVRAKLGLVCASFNLAVADSLRIKIGRAFKGRRVRSLVVAGGVAANSMIRSVMARVADEQGVELVLPSRSLCTDNAAMIAHAGSLLLDAGFSHGLDLEAIPRGRVVPEDWIGT